MMSRNACRFVHCALVRSHVEYCIHAKERCTALGASLEAGDEIVLCEAPKSLPAFLFGRDLILVFQIPRNDVNFSLEDFSKLPRREGLRGYITKFQEM